MTHTKHGLPKFIIVNQLQSTLDIAAVTDGVPCRLGDNDPRDPSLTPYPVNVIEGLKLMHAYELHEYTM